VPRIRPACGIAVAMKELKATHPVGIYMQHSTNSVIARTVNEKMPSAVVTFLLSAVLLALCEYGNEFKLAIISNAELLKYCVSVAFIVTSNYKSLIS
jgi:hypothetical protein